MTENENLASASAAADFFSLLDVGDKEKFCSQTLQKRHDVFVVMTDDEVEVERILAAIASADTSITGRGRTAPRFVVLGNTRWNRYGNLDRTVFFKDRVVFISTYHAKRDSQAILDFDRAYIRAFGALPSLYSYRGYDAALIFCPAMYNDIEYDMEGRSYTPVSYTHLTLPTNSRV